MRDRNLLVALEAFVCRLDGHDIHVTPGDLVRVGHPILKGHENQFGPLRVTFEHPEVEQATSAPGELRKVGRPRKDD